MRRTFTLSFCGLLVLALTLAGGRSTGGGRPNPERGPGSGRFTLNALDHHLDIYDLRGGRLGTSLQVDELVREYVGDILFTGKSFAVLENERYSGTILDLGKEEKPDTEFSLFYALRVWKRRFQIRQFPFVDRYLPYEGLDAREFFSGNRNPVTSASVQLAHLYILRLFHRTRVADDRVFLFRVIEYVPGVEVTVLWRELEDTFDEG